MFSANGCAHETPSNRTAAYMPAAATAPKKSDEWQLSARADQTKPDATEETVSTIVPCDTGFFRLQPSYLLDLVGWGGKTVEVFPGFAEDINPVAVLVPGARYLELIAMENKIRSITGGMVRATG